MGAQDQESLIRQACKSGLAGMSVLVSWRGQDVSVSDRHFDLAAGPPPENLPPEDHAAVQAAIGLSCLKPSQVKQIHQAQKTGDAKAVKAYQAYVLYGLCARRREARAIMTKVLSGDKQAKAHVEKCYLMAMGKVPAQPAVKRRMFVFASLCNQVMAELVELGSQEQEQPKQAPEKAPQVQSQAQAQARVPVDTTSAAISFDEHGNPSIVTTQVQAQEPAQEHNQESA